MAKKSAAVVETTQFSVGQTVRFIGQNDPELDFQNGELVVIKTEEPDGYSVIPLEEEGESGVEAAVVTPDEIEEVDEDEIEEEKKDIEESKAAAKKRAVQSKKASLKEIQEKKKILSKETKEEETEPVKTKTTPSKKVAIPSKKAVATKKVAAPKKEPVVEPPVVLNADVKAVLKDGASAIQAVREQLAAAAKNDLITGGLLAKIRQDKEHEKEKDPATGEHYSGKDGFEAFVENGLGLRYRKAMYLIQTYTFCVAHKINGAKAAKLGYVKLKELIGVVEAQPEKAEEWMDKAEEMTVRDLQVEVSTARKELNASAKPRGNSAKWITVTLQVPGDQAKVVEEAIALAKTQIDVDDDDNEKTQTNKAVFHIFSEYLQTNA